MTLKHRYLIFIQFLGFRYSGWQRQPGRKTVESMLLKTLGYILPGQKFKILGTGRTDARVSALETAFELFLDGAPIPDTERFLQLFNENLPADINVLSMKPVSATFNIINDWCEKEYLYFFAFGQKLHPFCAPFMTGIPQELDVQLMIQTAPLFIGHHNFRAYTAKNDNKRQFRRVVEDCTIEENTILSANFFPYRSYVLRIRGKGFMRYQVRMIMGALIEVGHGVLAPPDIAESLTDGNKITLSTVAPGSGLILNKVHFV
jgi:tRNA pseudouridine38-40 synthase